MDEDEIPTDEVYKAALEKLRDAIDIDRQPYPTAGRVTPDNPGGQFTATLPDGTKVDRREVMQDVLIEVDVLLRRERTFAFNVEITVTPTWNKADVEKVLLGALEPLNGVLDIAVSFREEVK
jgi:hypothetical protein